MTDQSTMTHKRGDSFDLLVTIPAAWPDGYFADHTVAAQVRVLGAGTKLADLTVAWVDPLTTRTLRLTSLNTTAWPLCTAFFDVQFTRVSDGFVTSTTATQMYILEDATHA